jgi:hypothetical protein
MTSPPPPPRGGGVVATWDAWTRSTLSALDASRLTRSLRPVAPFDAEAESIESTTTTRAGPSYSSASSSSSPMTVRVSPETMRRWLCGEHDLGESHDGGGGGGGGRGGDDDASGRREDHWRSLRLFSSNDYLGLSSHPAVRAAASDASLRHGCGPRSSPLVAGYTREHRELETALAALKKTEECALFPSGCVRGSRERTNIDRRMCHVIMFFHALTNRFHPRVVNSLPPSARRHFRRYAANCGVLQTLADGADVTIFRRVPYTGPHTTASAW